METRLAYVAALQGLPVNHVPSDDDEDCDVVAAQPAAGVTLGTIANGVHAAAAAAGVAQTAYSMAASAAKTPDPEPTTADIRGR